MNKNDKIEDSLNKIFSTSGYKMVDVSSKEITHRKALAVGEIILSSEVIEMIKNKKMPKGDPLAIAEVSGINGVKKTSELIPLCHPLSLDHISIHTEIDEPKNSIIVYCLVSAINLKSDEKDVKHIRMSKIRTDTKLFEKVSNEELAKHAQAEGASSK